MQTGFFAFDVETTGLDPSEFEIISLAAIILDSRLEVQEQKVWYAFPEKPVDPKAIEINGYTPESWHEKRAISQYTLCRELHNFTKDYHELIPLGHNVAFDLSFLKELYKNNGLEKEFKDNFSYHTVDTVSLAVTFDLARFGQKGLNYKLENLCNRFGIRLEKAHEALDDITATVSLFRYLIDAFNGETEYEIPAPAKYKTFIEKDDEGDWAFVAGKYKGKFLMQVANKEPGYIKWALEKVGGMSPEQVQALEEAVGRSS